MSKDKSYALHWFRRDLRVAGNPALSRMREEYEGRVVGVFCFDKKFLARPDFSYARFQFFLNTLASLRQELLDLGSDLIFYDTGPDEAFAELFEELKKNGKALPQSLSWNRDYEPYALDRDERMKQWFHEQGVHTATERDHILIEPHEIVKKTKPIGPYQIFTPFSKKWMEQFATEEITERLEEQRKGLAHMRKVKKGTVEAQYSIDWKKLLDQDKADAGWRIFESYSEANRKKVEIDIPKAGSLAILASLEDFRKRMDDFSEARDVPSINGTSHFSIYFKNGSLTSAQAIAYYELHKKPKLTKGESKFLSELIWREFAYYIIAKHPRVEKEAFDDRFRTIDWGNRKDWFKAWCEGKTGYPIVDAGMRQLNETGWMHNRVRMIVASFLTKDLHIDWKWGEKYFMEKLIDGDLALNNMGWQWAASTGCDAQPYFRIFNPSRQSTKFDPQALYIKEYIPELKNVPAKAIHDLTEAARPKAYPAPIVDHDKQRLKALEIYKVRAKRQ